MTFFPLHNTVQFHISISTRTKCQYTPLPMILELCGVTEKRVKTCIENCGCTNTCYTVTMEYTK